MKNKKFNFITAFWGETHRDFFTTLLLPSLIAPKNIPSLDGNEHTFHIYTTEFDFKIIKNLKLFKKCLEIIKIKFHSIDHLLIESSDKFKIVSHCHKEASEIFHNEKSIGVFCTPDMILSNGSVKSLQNLSKKDYTFVLCSAMRFELYGCLDEFHKNNLIKESEPLSINSRDLINIAVNNLHSETKGYIWNSRHYTTFPISSVWPNAKTNNYIVHSFSWAPLLVDYSQIENHDVSTLENWTLDGDYIHKNFNSKVNKIHIVSDTDEIALVSFTSEEEYSCLPKPYEPYVDTPFKNIIKMCSLHNAFHHKVMDNTKRKIFKKTIYYHSSKISFHDRLLAFKIKLTIKIATSKHFSFFLKTFAFKCNYF